MFYEECENLASRHPEFRNKIKNLDKKLSSMDSSSIFNVEDVAKYLDEEKSNISIIFEKLYQLDLLLKENYYVCSCGNLFDVNEINETLYNGDLIECRCGEEINSYMDVKTVYRLKPDKVLKKRDKDIKTKTDRIEKDFDNILIGVVVALDIELDAVLKRFNHEQLRNDLRTYYIGHINPDSESYKIAVVRSSHPGNTPAAVVTRDLIKDLDPKYVVLIGIAAGYDDDGLKLGDVVVSDSIIDYDYTKEFNEKTLNRQRMFNSDPYLIECVKKFKWDGKIETKKPDGSSDPNIKVGHIATGNKVIASTIYKEKIKSIHDKIIAIEMESGGVADAAQQLKNPIGILVIKGISDMGDKDKGDDWHEYSANVAAQFFVDFLRSGLI